jgi:AAA family ATP:ADP antiporter
MLVNRTARQELQCARFSAILPEPLVGPTQDLAALDGVTSDLPDATMATSVAIEPSSPEKGVLDRLLSLFTRVEAGEGLNCLLLALNVFLLLAAYYIIRPVRQSLILSEGGAEVQSYSAAGQALLLLLVVPAYGAFAARVNRMRLITWVTLFFISNLGIFYILGAGGMRVGVAFFLWMGIFNVLVIAQFWAFANDVYSEEQGKRLFAIVGVGASLGAWVGAVVAARLFSLLGPYQLMLLSAAVLASCILVTHIVNKRESIGGGVSQSRAAQEPLGKEGGFRLVLQNRYLLLIALLIVLLNVVNTSGEFLLGKLVVLQADSRIGFSADAQALKRAFIGEFYGDFYGWVNLLGLLFQLFLVSRLFRYIGVRGALFILPLIALGGYSLLLAMPLLGAVRFIKILENSTDYSIQNTARHALFLPTSREAKYKAKAAIDTFFWRTGDVMQAGVVFLGTQAALNISGFAAINLVFVVLWLVVVLFIYREHKKITSATSEALPQRPTPARKV